MLRSFGITILYVGEVEMAFYLFFLNRRTVRAVSSNIAMIIIRENLLRSNAKRSDELYFGLRGAVEVCAQRGQGAHQ